MALAWPNLRLARAVVPQITGTRADGSPFDPFVEPWEQLSVPALDVLERGGPPGRRAEMDAPLQRQVRGHPLAPQPLHRFVGPQLQAALDDAEQLGHLIRCQRILWALIWLVAAYLTVNCKQEPGA